MWDLKTTTTSKSPNSTIRHGLKQIQRNPGGIILDFGKNKVSMDDVINTINKRMSASARKTVDIMIIQDGKLVKFLRYKK